MGKEREIVHRIDLKHPFKRGADEEIKYLEFRRAKGKDVKHLLNGTRTEESIIKVAVRLTGHPTDVFDEMDAGDFWEVVEYVGKLLPNSQATGEEDSAS